MKHHQPHPDRPGSLCGLSLDLGDANAAPCQRCELVAAKAARVNRPSRSAPINAGSTGIAGGEQSGEAVNEREDCATLVYTSLAVTFGMIAAATIYVFAVTYPLGGL